MEPYEETQMLPDLGMKYLRPLLVTLATCVTGVTPGYARRLSTKQNHAQAINTL